MHKLSILSSIILRKILIKENFFCRLVERSKPLIIELLGIKQKKMAQIQKKFRRKGAFQYFNHENLI